MEEGWKLYQVVDEDGNRRYLVMYSEETFPVEDFLEDNESVETDCWLADVLGCEIRDVTVIKNW